MEEEQEPRSAEAPQPPEELEERATEVTKDSVKSPEEEEVQRREVAERIRVKEDLLRQLRMVKVYRNRAETRDLDEVTGKWLQVCQRAIEDLYEKVKDGTGSGCELQVSSLGEFVDMLSIDHTLVKFDKSSETFLQ